MPKIVPAKTMGLKLVISSPAHHIFGIGNFAIFYLMSGDASCNATVLLPWGDLTITYMMQKGIMSMWIICPIIRLIKP